MSAENEYDAVSRSAFFDAAFYLAQNPDVATSGLDPVWHYMEFGAREGRNPGPGFDAAYYREQCDALGLSVLNPLTHYLTQGQDLGLKIQRDPEAVTDGHDRGAAGLVARTMLASGLFDSEWYLETYPDVANSGLDPIVHYAEFGAAEGRNPGPAFDAWNYREQCEALGLVVRNPLIHYLIEGRSLGLRAQRDAEPAKSDTPVPKEWKVERLLTSGLFDLAFYNQAHGHSFADEREGLHHFVHHGAHEGKRPNFYFDPAWYLEKNPDVREAGIGPLFHYFIQGEAEGRRPSVLFDPQWYRTTYAIGAEVNALAHYLAHRTEFQFNPIPEFDAAYYGEENKDVKDAGVDPFAHYISWGYKEERNPSPNFNTRFYARRYLRGVRDVHPFLHFLARKDEPGIYGIPAPDESTIAREVRTFTKPSRDFEDVRPLPPHVPRKAKVLAYHLTQFHAFAENDAWWGKGFTEWTNIARGVPRYKGHFQPRVPRDLGFYSLNDAETLRRQAEMAKAGGLYGFIYYYYWFNGKRLMEKPLEAMLADPSIDMPFALMWANENWTRRWDGHENEVLISQDYDPRDDERMLAEFARHFRDKRYIRIQGRPLLMLYRPGIVPNCAAVVEKWREIFRTKFKEEPILVMAQAFDDNDPTRFGCDGAIEFPPHKLTSNMPSVNREIEILDDEFAGKVFTYDAVMQRSLLEPPQGFPQIKTAVPSWDNDARRQGSGLSLLGSTPRKFEDWLGQLVKRAQAKPFFGESFVCINAWNEWCEAAYLEPDLHYGGAYLNAASRAITGLGARDNCSTKLLLVGHDAFPSGSQHLLLHVGRELRRQFGLTVEYLLLDGGKMETQYRDVAPVWIEATEAGLARRLETLHSRGFASAIVNTTVSAKILPDLKSAGFHTVTLIHELPKLIADNKLEAGAKAALQISDRVIFAAEVVRDQVAKAVGMKPGPRARILPQGLYKKIEVTAERRAAIRKEFGIGEKEQLVLGVGYADPRKGFDLFLQAWRESNKKRKERIHFCWAGDMDPTMKRELADELNTATETGTFHLPGFRSDIDGFFSAADVYALTSREDPFPTVVHEALYAGLPVVAFDKAGGMSDFLKRTKLGTVVPHDNVKALADALAKALATDATQGVKDKRRGAVETELSFERYVSELYRLALPDAASISVAVPNYNYARYLPERLGSIFAQTHPTSEVLLLDDCSKDDSLAVAERVAKDVGRPLRVIANTINSGSVFKQWRKAAESATGEFLWIAEADDLSDPAFLDRVLAAMKDDPNIVMGFSDSAAIDTDGRMMWPSYKEYCAQIPGQELPESKTVDGTEFVRDHLAVRNLILNVSSVVWRRSALLDALKRCEKELGEFSMAGDWRLYLEVLSQPGARIAYISDELNLHRRHATSVTHALNVEKHIAEIGSCQRVAGSKQTLPKYVTAQQREYLNKVSGELRQRADHRKPVKSNNLSSKGRAK